LTKNFKEKIDSDIKNNESYEDKPIQRKKNLVAWIVFIFTLSIVLVSLVSVVFPALIVSSDSTIAELENLGVGLPEVDPWSQGVWASSLLAANLLVLGTTILYFKKKLPNQIKRSVDFVFSFEVSKRVALIIILVLLGIYVGFSASELGTVEHWEDYPGVIKRVESWSPSQIFDRFEVHVRYFLLWSSMTLFGNLTVIPFIASVSLLILTYFFTVTITKKKICRNCSFCTCSSKQLISDL